MSYKSHILAFVVKSAKRNICSNGKCESIPFLSMHALTVNFGCISNVSIYWGSAALTSIMWRSVPQTPAQTTFTITSCFSMMAGRSVFTRDKVFFCGSNCKASISGLENLFSPEANTTDQTISNQSRNVVSSTLSYIIRRIRIKNQFLGLVIISTCFWAHVANVSKMYQIIFVGPLHKFFLFRKTSSWTTCKQRQYKKIINSCTNGYKSYFNHCLQDLKY